MNAVAVCFYTPDSWKELKNVAADKNSLDETYEEWLSQFHHIMSTLKHEGVDTFALNVDIDHLQKWCKERKLKNTRANRAKYASEIAEKRSQL